MFFLLWPGLYFCGGERSIYFRYLEQVAKYVGRAGDIFKFSGDAMIILWPENDRNAKQRQNKHGLKIRTLRNRGRSNNRQNPETIDENEGNGGGSKRSSCENGNKNFKYHNDIMERAIQCGLTIQKNLHQSGLTKGVNLSVKIGIGFRRCKTVFVGGALNRCEYVAIGEPLTQAFSCEHNAQAGEVIIHESINNRLDQKKFKTQQIDNTHCFHIVKQITKIRAKRLRNGTRKMGLSPHKIRILNQFIQKLLHCD